MKLGAKPSKQSSARREQLVNERARATPLRQIYPKIEQLRIELTFIDTRGRSHSPQLHTLYPAARAYFRFPCPCTDCDGDIDLGELVAALVIRTTSGTRVTRGTALCNGVRRDLPPDKSTCSLRIDYHLAAKVAQTASTLSGPPVTQDPQVVAQPR